MLREEPNENKVFGQIYLKVTFCKWSILNSEG